jgi:hypothetical protein
VARSVTKAFPAALAAALSLFLTRSVSAACPLCGCMSWFCPPRPSLPVGSPSFGYNKTVWQTWPEFCAAPQPAILAHPITVDAPVANATSRPDDWANTRPNAGGSLLEISPTETKLTPSQSAVAGESPYNAVRPASAPVR